ncbi:DoxX family protein [Niabella digestorum]|uniref:DoxX family protein n=1 Tax=Niabella digestorum TaxID=3117701 RepID=A0ABU7RF82_9BACT
MSPASNQWSTTTQWLFRFFFIYFLLQVLPLDYKFYKDVFAIRLGAIYYGDIFRLAHYYPEFISSSPLYNWFLIVALSVIGAIVWSAIDKQAKEYAQLYYWLRVLLRYRLAFALTAYAFIKIFPLQSPFPTLSQLNTQYGEFTTWQLFSVSLGAAPLYQIFLGWVELVAAVLLLWRRTTAIGAFIVLLFTGNVLFSNLAYEGGEVGYSLFLVLLALVLFAYDAQRIFNVVVWGRKAIADRFLPIIKPQFKVWRWVLKGVFIFFILIFYGFKTYQGYKKNPHNIPIAKGLPDVAGVYNVAHFSINNDTLPYNSLDPIRWQQVVFEEWATLSIKSNRDVIIDSNNVEQVSPIDWDKKYESQGTIRRHFYAYTVDSIQQLLHLHNKNAHYPADTFTLHYARPDTNTIILQGRINNTDSIYTVLTKIPKKYLLIEGRRKPQTL